ncbi:MAG TPA: hypothetical protein VH561_21605 [Micromonosporaceae bacterium]|jgi:hypothetical protein
MLSLDIERELTELAGRARQYADAAKVLLALRRRRRRRVAVVVTTGSAALTLVAVVAGMDILLPGTRTSLPGPARTSASAGMPVLPPVVDPPQRALVLPTDHGVGRTSLIYQAASGAATYLVAQDGTQYEVPVNPLSGTLDAETFKKFPLELSSDGRWLVAVGPDATTLRDLTSTTVRRLEHARPGAWSPDGQWLVYYRDHDAFLLNLGSGQSWPMATAQLGDGELALALPESDGQVVTGWFYGGFDEMRLEWTDPVNGRQTRSLAVTEGGILKPYEHLSWQLLLAQCAGIVADVRSLGGGGSLLVGIYDEPEVRSCTDYSDPRAVDYAVVSTTTGRVTSRLNLPAAAAGPSWYGSGDTIVYATKAAESGRIQLNLVDPTGHSLGPLTSLPAGAVFDLPGALYLGPLPGMS